MEVVVLFSLVIGLLLIGVPIAVALGLSSTLFLLVFSDSSLASVAARSAALSLGQAGRDRRLKTRTTHAGHRRLLQLGVVTGHESITMISS